MDRGWSQEHGPPSEFSCGRGKYVFSLPSGRGRAGKLANGVTKPFGWLGGLADRQMEAGWPALGAQAVGWTGDQAARRPDNRAVRQPGGWGEADRQMSGSGLGSQAIGWPGGRVAG